MEIIDELNDIKTRLKIKNIDLSKETGISQSHISDIFNKKSQPSMEYLSKIMKALNVNFNVSLISDKGADYNVSNEVKELTSSYLNDFSSWSVEDKSDLINYLKSKRTIIDLKKKDRNK